MIVVGLLGVATMVVVMWDKFNQPEFRAMRAAVFVSLVSFHLSYLCSKPGPASSVGKRPSTNPEIRVRFSEAADEFFFRVHGRLIHPTLIYSEISLQCKKSNNAIYWRKKRTLHSLSK